MSRVPEHVPVLLGEATEALRLRSGGRYLDATFGRGGHAAEILARIGPDGRLYALDRDPEAVAAAAARFGSDPRFAVRQGNFAELDAALTAMGCRERLDGVLLDLGVSSPQLDAGERGFSFRADGPLDMRMDPSDGESAASWLARVSEAELARVLREYGEERFARRIARAVVARRRQAPIERTGALAEIVAQAVPSREPGKHPATRSFQAIRMVINDELGAIGRALEQAVERLAPGGRLVVISFHSLEDRRVKRFIRSCAQPPAGSRRLPAPEAFRPRLRRCGKALRPGPGECAANPRARSAVMRVAERTDAP